MYSYDVSRNRLVALDISPESAHAVARTDRNIYYHHKVFKFNTKETEMASKIGK